MSFDSAPYRTLASNGRNWHILQLGDGRVQLDFGPSSDIEALLINNASGQTPTIMLLERAPGLIASYEVTYQGPDQVQVVELLRRELAPANRFVGTLN